MKVLSVQELHKVQGAVGPFGAAVGAVGGAAGYLIHQQLSGSSFSPTTLAVSAGLGAAAGSGLGPVAAIWGFNGELAGGMISGVASRYGK